MRRVISIWSLAARTTLYKIGLLLLLTAAAQWAAFSLVLHGSAFPVSPTLQEVARASYISVIAAASFLLLCVILCSVGLNRPGAKTSYTIARLRLSERRIFLVWSLHNFVCLVLFWAVQTLIVLLLAQMYQSRYPGGPQLLLVSSYRTELLHSLLPLDDGTRWARNFALAATLAVSAAAMPLHQRHGRRSIAALILSAVTAFLFSMQTGSYSWDVVILVLALCVLGQQIYRVFWGDTDEE